jgi:hypothetical protein
MAATARAVTRESLGAWLIKATGGSPATRDHLRTGFTSLTTRCVRASYRTDLVEAGQPVLFWVSGDDTEHPAGIYGQGRTTGPAVPELGGAEDGRVRTLVVPLRLEPLEVPVLRAELRLHPGLSDLEVLRMPAGSNPSYVTRTQLGALRGHWPQVTVG